MIKVLIVEDDPMVAQLNKQHTSEVEGFEVIGVASHAEEAMQLLEEKEVHLILLDVFMPGINGIHFLKKLRKQEEDVDVILITAASQMDQIQQSLRLGAIDYLIKPFEYERLYEALHKYKANRFTIQRHDSPVTQKDVDVLLRKEEQEGKARDFTPQTLPKGLTKNTLETIRETIESNSPEAFSTNEMAEATKVSRVSVRKYLKFLSDIGYLKEELVYGVGRPIYKYYLNEQNQHIIEQYVEK
ncbi:response regulator [Pontibacillus yanchengensis]|uniref:Transcriptional regulator n=1 Tax=Pontibacillus yanchengensis Y32 TaxID=1385514 RepID=A0A0A2TK67_9BACI|nr:response regulator [Pontibacillus yanchengensis]KGP74481.1 transcriptional regulator [Pontibacillus yanchengensis Y32]